MADVAPADVAPLLEWSVYFLDYRSVKRLISTLPAAAASSAAPEGAPQSAAPVHAAIDAFSRALSTELARVARFWQRKREWAEGALCRLEGELHRLEHRAPFTPRRRTRQGSITGRRRGSTGALLSPRLLLSSEEDVPGFLTPPPPPPPPPALDAGDGAPVFSGGDGGGGGGTDVSQAPPTGAAQLEHAVTLALPVLGALLGPSPPPPLETSLSSGSGGSDHRDDDAFMLVDELVDDECANGDGNDGTDDEGGGASSTRAARRAVVPSQTAALLSTAFLRARKAAADVQREVQLMDHFVRLNAVGVSRLVDHLRARVLPPPPPPPPLAVRVSSLVEEGPAAQEAGAHDPREGGGLGHDPTAAHATTGELSVCAALLQSLTVLGGGEEERQPPRSVAPPLPSPHGSSSGTNSAASSTCASPASSSSSSCGEWAAMPPTPFLNSLPEPRVDPAGCALPALGGLVGLDEEGGTGSLDGTPGGDEEGELGAAPPALELGSPAGGDGGPRHHRLRAATFRAAAPSLVAAPPAAGPPSSSLPSARSSSGEATTSSSSSSSGGELQPPTRGTSGTLEGGGELSPPPLELLELPPPPDGGCGGAAAAAAPPPPITPAALAALLQASGCDGAAVLASLCGGGGGGGHHAALAFLAGGDSGALLARAAALQGRVAAIEPTHDEWRETRAYTVGVFDGLHRGHVNLLGALRSFGGRVCVGVHTCESIAQLKGRPPVQPLAARLAAIAPYADETFVVAGADPTPFLQAAVPAAVADAGRCIFVRGDDMPHFPARAWVERHMPVVLLPRTADVSSSFHRLIYHHGDSGGGGDGGGDGGARTPVRGSSSSSSSSSSSAHTLAPAHPACDPAAVVAGAGEGEGEGEERLLARLSPASPLHRMPRSARRRVMQVAFSPLDYEAKPLL